MPASFTRVNAAKVRRFPQLDRIVKSLGDWKRDHSIEVRLGFSFMVATDQPCGKGG